MLRRTALPVSGVLLLLAAVTGCSADAEQPAAPAVPARTPVATPSATTAAPTPEATTPTPVATVSLPAPTFRPEGTFNEDDAIGFAAYYLLVLNHARATGDPSLLRSISEPDCGTCAYHAEGVDQAREQRLVGENLDIHFDSGMLTYYSPETQEADILVEMSNGPGQYLRQDGSTFGQVPALTSTGVIEVHMRAGRWLVQGLPG
ncbi:hypothetical protein GTR02_00145 [Kineococcus sp. R8]|uniref:DUF6318 family protein n=1 Tax=Kineococcus siccus TaxID=2696567 RepID=UPI00141338FD|nr:DUF6318 family protein [Kineococcus siccus]NAZ80232.1 hypothetical protein [Kineococcus siccus]